MSYVLTSLRISLLISLTTDAITFISFCSGRAAVLASEKWSETTGRRQGQGWRSSFVALGPGLSRRVGRPHGKVSWHPKPQQQSFPIGQESAYGWAKCTLVGSPACLALPPTSLVAFMDCCFEKQVCMPILSHLSLPNPFITALVQESGLSEVEMNN